MKIIEVPIVVSNTEGQGTRHSSVAARGVGGATDRDSLSTREANGATVLMEEDTAAVTKLLLVWLVIEVREIVGRLLVSDEVEQPQEFAVNAARGGHKRGQKRQRSMSVVRFAIRADFVSSGLIEELVRPVRVAERAMALRITGITDEIMTQGVVNDQIILAHEASANNVEIGTANAIAGGHVLDAAGIAGSLKHGHDCAQHMLMSAEPIPAVAVAAVDVIAIMSISLTAARFLSNGSQDRVVSVPKELTEERHIVRRGDELQAGRAAFAR